MVKPVLACNEYSVRHAGSSGLLQQHELPMPRHEIIVICQVSCVSKAKKVATTEAWQRCLGHDWLSAFKGLDAFADDLIMTEP